VIRELLAFQPKGRGTNIKGALDMVNRILKRRGIIFLVSDFLIEPEHYHQALFVTNRRHDVIAIDVHDPLERRFEGVGLVELEDAESGSTVLVDTSSRAWQRAFVRRITDLEAKKTRVFNRVGIDNIKVTTARDYVLALTLFFQKRASRLKRGL
jgi:uncharacterized protein (DUF58 family)